MSYLIDPTRIPGAILETRNGLIQHRGIRGRHNPFTGEQPILHSTPGSCVRPASDSEFSGGRPIYAVHAPPTMEAGFAAVDRMERIQGLLWNGATANCQHTTNWAACGVARSEQLEAALGAVLLGGLLWALSRN